MPSAPAFLTLRTSRNATAWASAIDAARGDVLVAADGDGVTVLEPGTRHSGVVIARFAFAADRDAFWASPAAGALAAADPALVALSCAGLPWDGWPGHDVPTIATVTIPATDGPQCHMLIEGTGADQDRMDRYRDVILPMIRERGAYYIAFELGGNVHRLAGQWDEGIFAISLWPSRAAVEAFWFSDRYQNVAIPIRAGVGRFDVQIADAHGA